MSDAQEHLESLMPYVRAVHRASQQSATAILNARRSMKNGAMFHAILGAVPTGLLTVLDRQRRLVDKLMSLDLGDGEEDLGDEEEGEAVQ